MQVQIQDGKLQATAKKDLGLKTKTIQVTVNKGCEFDVKGFFEYIDKIGGGGHSFSIVVDPDDPEYKKVFGFDGDGADRIIDVKEI